jgi:adenosylmethionine-8-amino-7-oxononanoate aminotransferase
MTTAKGLTAGYIPMGACSWPTISIRRLRTPAPCPWVMAAPIRAIRWRRLWALKCCASIAKAAFLPMAKVGKRFAARMDALRSHPLVGDVRYRGLLGAIELVANKETKEAFPAELAIGDRLSQMTWDNGVIARCFANAVIGFAPALTCTDEEMDTIFDRVQLTLDQLLEQADIRAAIGK